METEEAQAPCPGYPSSQEAESGHESGHKPGHKCT